MESGTEKKKEGNPSVARGGSFIQQFESATIKGGEVQCHVKLKFSLPVELTLEGGGKGGH